MRVRTQGKPGDVADVMAAPARVVVHRNLHPQFALRARGGFRRGRVSIGDLLEDDGGVHGGEAFGIGGLVVRAVHGVAVVGVVSGAWRREDRPLVLCWKGKMGRGEGVREGSGRR